jgi:hypothetical protein
VRVFKEKGFSRFQRKEGISDKRLCEAMRDAAAGLIEADLGLGLIKQRVARPGHGKRGGYRTIIAYRVKKRRFSCSVLPRAARPTSTPTS